MFTRIIGSTIAMVVVLGLVAASAPAGLVARWSFNEGSGTTTGDAAGHLDPGTLTQVSGGLPLWVAGRTGDAGDYALSFSTGSTLNYVKVNDKNSWLDAPNVSNQFTIAAWVYDRGQTTWGRILSGSGPATEEFEYAVGQSGTATKDGFDLYFRSGSEWAPTNLVAQNQWSHIAVTYSFNPSTNAATATFYLDGQLKSTQTQTSAGNKPKLLDFVQIGNFQYNGANRPFEGTIDELRFYDNAMGGAEVAALGAILTATPPAGGQFDFGSIGQVSIPRIPSGNASGEFLGLPVR